MFEVVCVSENVCGGKISAKAKEFEFARELSTMDRSGAQEIAQYTILPFPRNIKQVFSKFTL